MSPITATRPLTVVRGCGRPDATVAERPRLTSDGRFLMQMRLAHLLETAIPEARDGLGDGTRTAEQIQRLERLCVEAIWLQRLLERAGTLPRPTGEEVELGAYVRVGLVDGEGTWVRPVPAVEAILGDERVSATSPLGAALLGARVGDMVVVDGPAGPWTCVVLEIAASDPESLVAAC